MRHPRLALAVLAAISLCAFMARAAQDAGNAAPSTEAAPSVTPLVKDPPIFDGRQSHAAMEAGDDEKKAFLGSLMAGPPQSHEDPEVQARREKLALAIHEDPEVQARRKQLALAMLDREIEKMREARDELLWYNRLGRFMFGVVHVVLGVALWMAWLEFDNARRARAKSAPLKRVAAQKGKGKQEPVDQEETAAPHELKLGLDGIAFKSSLQGTAILALAFGFYFLYLKFVYPIVLVP